MPFPGIESVSLCDKMVKVLHDLVLTRSSTREAWGFRIIGGKDEGQTFKVNLMLIIEIYLLHKPAYLAHGVLHS